MLTVGQQFDRIKAWVDNPRTKTAPVCGHNENHGRLQPMVAAVKQGAPYNQEVLMHCTKCNYAELAPATLRKMPKPN